MIQYNESVNEAREGILDSLKWELEQIGTDECDSKEIDLYSIVHETIDDIVSSNNRAENLKAIDDTGHENDIDEGMIDRNADISMQIAQIAYCCIETELWNDDLFQVLQHDIVNKNVDHEEAQELLEAINGEDE